MEWLAWLIIACAVLFGCGRGCAWGYRRHRRVAGHEMSGGRVGSGRREALRAAPSEPAIPAEAREPVAVGGRERVESPLETLQRRFIEGSIDVEEYERELDRLYHLETPRARD